MENGYSKKIDLSKLIVNPENYRHKSVDSEGDAINIMLTNLNPKIKALTKHILENGLNPNENISVTPFESKYIVLEGNRRITACKIIENVEILKQYAPKFYGQYKKLLDSYPNHNPINKISCVIYVEPTDANKWIELKHTGENAGAGTIPWDTYQKRKFDEVNGKGDITFQLIQYIKTCPIYETSIKSNITSIKITNLGRLISDPAVRGVIGLELKKGTLYKLYPDAEIKKGLSKMLLELMNPNFKVDKIYSKNNRIDYISKFDDNSRPNSETFLSTPVELSILVTSENDSTSPVDDQTTFLDPPRCATNPINDNTSPAPHIKDELKETKLPNTPNDETTTSTPPKMDNQTPKGTSLPPVPNNPPNPKRSKPDINKRKCLIPNDVILKISNPRLNQIYKELKTLEIDTHPNCTSVIFRVFMEFTVDEFIHSQNITGIHQNTNLKDKIMKCVEFLKSQKLITDDEAKPVRVCASNPDSIFSTTIFNAYVHNIHMIPDPLNLKNTWNNLSKFIIILHQNI